MRSTLLKNGYPLDLLNEKIFERYKKLIANLHKTNQVCEIYNIDYRESRKVITFAYVQNFQEQLYRIFKKTKLQIIFTIENSFQKKLFPTLKDRTQKKFKYNVIYDINCIQCNKKYIGQTCRFLHNRLLLNMLDQLKTKIIKLHLQNVLLPINILSISKIQKF